MVRIHKGWLAYGIAGALIVSAPFALADDPSQQDPNQSSDQSSQTQEQKSDKSMQGQTQGQSVQKTDTKKGMTQEQKMDQEKSTLRDKVKKELDDAQAQIDTLQNDLKSKTGAARMRDEKLLKQALQYKEALNVDLQTIENASAKDWAQIHATVNQDLNQFRGTVRRVANAQKPAKPRETKPKGSTNVQPQGGSQQEQKQEQK